MQENRPTLDGLEQVLELIASDPRMPSNFPDWIRGSLRSGVGKIRVLRYILDHASSGATPPRILDVGAQFGSLAVYAVKLGCRLMAENRAVAGTPDKVREHLQRNIDEGGLNYLLCRFAFGDVTQQESVNSINLFTSRVMADLRPADGMV